MHDRETGKSRGFGFITFDSEETVEKVLANAKEHVLMDKWIDCKKAVAKPGAPLTYHPRPSPPPQSYGYPFPPTQIPPVFPRYLSPAG